MAVQYLLLLLVGFLPLSAGAYSLSVEVSGRTGGRIAVPGQGECLSACKWSMQSLEAISLFAVPNPGYRFAEWAGECRDTLGPLCTLAADRNFAASARFEPMDAEAGPVKALVLLHRPGGQASVWNDFVGRYFGHRCPVIYGGVILDDDAGNPANQVRCYRLDLSYYRRFFQHAGQATDQATRVDVDEAKEASEEQRVHEIQAALLGIANRHPHSNFMLVGQELGALANQILIQDVGDLADAIVGVLALVAQTPLPQEQGGRYDGNDQSGGHRMPVMLLNAQPEQNRKLNRALGQLAPSWW